MSEDIVRWKNLKIPQKVIVERVDEENNYVRFLVEPLERGFGATIGNSLRRVLLSSIEGTAVIAFKLNDVKHEFATLSGMYQDIPAFILNLRNVVVQFEGDEVQKISYRGTKKAGDLKLGECDISEGVTIVDPKFVLCSFSEDKEIDLEIFLSRGRGFRTSEEQPLEKEEGLICIDSFFSPVKSVSFQVDDKRMGQRTDLDSLRLDIRTDGSITPHDALSHAATIWEYYITSLFKTLSIERDEEEESDDNASSSFNSILSKSISEFELSVRSANCLEAAGINTLAELCSSTQPELMAIPNFGKRCFNEIMELLESNSLTLGMNIKQEDN